jgi:hypothetical protein
MKAPKRRGTDVWLRASELPQPMEPTHFLRIAGQSARQVADDGSTEGGITESLAFMNGGITESLMNGSTPFMNAVSKKRSRANQVTFLYETFLSRQPTKKDVERSVVALEEGAELQDIVWALLNSREFIFIQ